MSVTSREAFATHFDTLQFQHPVDSISTDETLVPEALREFRADVDTIQTLPRISVRAPGRITQNPDLEVIGMLGEGGMGLVRLANQIPLRRNVAVKTLRATAHEKAAEALLKEAYVTGHLEHPNVVPIYTLGRDDDGAPLIVMKRIEGEAWVTEIEREHVAGTLDLGRHLEILEQVCSAVRFAHSRGVVHRDIKPENVMIGPYDEVYLLDWGIAISVNEDESLLPKRADAVGVAGTPSYMAPEMTLDDAQDVDVRTDVYLLGATLHHILVGSPRHTGDSVFEAMYSAVRSEPYDYPPDVPAQLAEIANRACSKEKSDRYETAVEFRDAVQEWLDHRGSIEVAAEAMRSLETLERLLDEERTSVVEVQIHDLAGECRFGFRQAQRMWPGNEVAIEGEKRFLCRLFAFYLESEQAIAARATLGELGDDATDEMERELDALETRLAENQAKVDKLEKMADDLDLRTAARSRSRLAIMLGVLWTLSTSWAAYGMHSGPPQTNAELIEGHFFTAIRSIAIVAVSVFIFRKRIFANLANRRLMYVLFGVMGTMVVMRYVFLETNTPYVPAQAGELALYGFAVLVLGIITDLRICFLSACFFIPSVAGVFYPDYQLWILVPFNLLIFLGLGWMWSPRQMDKRITLMKPQ